MPIYAYGHPVLKKVGEPIDDFENIDWLVQNMFHTMHHAQGVGLAAPQIGKAIRLFIVETAPMFEENEADKGIKKVFINPEMIEEAGTPTAFEEGCLSIPNIRGVVERPSKIKIKYLDEKLQEQIEEFDGINARVIQHEYDHIEGILFVELLKPLKKKMLSKKLDAIKKGKISPDYKMVFARR